MKVKKLFFLPVIICIASFLFTPSLTKAQQIFFEENFETDTLSNNWQKVNGNCYITAADTLKNMPDKSIGHYVLKCNSAGYIRLMVDIDTAKTRLIKVNFTYYAYLKGPAVIVEIEFLRKGYKDGYKGKLTKIILPVKGSWASFQKNFRIPAEANSVWVTFSQAELKTSNPLSICIDNITMTDID